MPPAGTDAIYRSLFDSFNPDSDGRISPLEVLSRLERSGLRPDDPRIAEALAGLAGADGGSRQLSFTQFKALAQHNSSLIRRAVEGNLAVPDFAALTADITRMYDELLPVRSGWWPTTSRSSSASTRISWRSPCARWTGSGSPRAMRRPRSACSRCRRR